MQSEEQPKEPKSAEEAFPNREINRREFLGGASGMMFAGATLTAEAASLSPQIRGPVQGAGQAPVQDVIVVGHQYRQDDMPSIAAAPDGSFWVSWLSFNGNRDDVALRHFRDNDWQDLQWVPGTSGDAWLPHVAVDGSNRVWAVWSQQVDGTWDIYARRFDPLHQEWGRLEKLSSGPLPDINLRVWSDSKGRAAVVWQGFRRDSATACANSNIFLRILEGEGWSEEIRVTHRAANDWDPAVAISNDGTVWVAYDSYKNGNYDVMLTPVRSSHAVGPEMEVAATPDFEARATLAIDALDRVWVAWEAGLPNWGKDNGHILDGHQVGAPLGGFREPRIACYDHGRWLEPQTPLASAFKGANTYQPHVVSDGDGSVWVIAMMRKSGPAPSAKPHKHAYWEYWVEAPFGYWEYWATRLNGGDWDDAFALPHSKGRSSTRMGATLGADHDLWLAWPTDNREEVYYHRPVRQQVYAGRVVRQSGKQAPSLKTRTANRPQAALSSEAEDVRILREYTAQHGGKRYRLVRGDLHRHTELSWDEGGVRSGSLQDFYRYMIDAASMDFGASTDHQGGAWPYWWWYSQKMTDMYHVPGTYISLFGHERSSSYPQGHRNAVFAKRSESHVIPLYVQEGDSLYAFPLTSEGDEPADEAPQAVRNDIELLYEDVRRSHGIVIPHTTGTGMGTDWRIHDPEVEPVVEIFQGLRQSYEQIGAPYCVTEAQVTKDAAAATHRAQTLADILFQLSRSRADGMVSNGWQKGYKLGVICSSDHISTHLSYAMIYTDDPTREGIIEAIRQRHTYGATDNILLDVRMGEHLMGDSFETLSPQPIRIKARGAGSISTIDIIRDSKIIHTVHPGHLEVEMEFLDREMDRNRHYYYVRLLQKNGMIAWSSPFFVNYT